MNLLVYFVYCLSLLSPYKLHKGIKIFFCLFYTTILIIPIMIPIIFPLLTLEIFEVSNYLSWYT